MGVDAWGFDEERQAVARRLRSKRLRLGAVRTASFGVIAGILVFGGAAACRDLILSLGWPGWASVVTFLAVLFVVFAASEVPFSYVGGFGWAHALGLSTKTRRSNAAVMGFGRTRRIIVTDTLLRDFPIDEVDSVLAHELAHQSYLDPIRGFLVGSLSSLVIVALTAWLYAISHSSFGIVSIADVAGLPLVAVLFSLVALPFRPVALWWSRARWGRADRFSLELTRNPSAFAAAMVRLHDCNLGVAIPSRWEKWLFYSHPSGRERVAFARSFAA